MQQALQVMRRNVELEARLIDDLLDLTRVGTGKIHLNPETVDVHCLLENAIEICRIDIATKLLELNISLDATEFSVEGDPARLQQIFWNLIRNATKFTQQAGITIRTQNDRGEIIVEVQDTGIGMDEPLVTWISHPFEQGNSGRYGGLGLGLTITKELVELHHGSIDVKSAGPGHGSTFQVTFPTVSAVTECKESAPAEQVPIKRLRILLVEDHLDRNESLTMLLQLGAIP